MSVVKMVPLIPLAPIAEPRSPLPPVAQGIISPDRRGRTGVAVAAAVAAWAAIPSAIRPLSGFVETASDNVWQQRIILQVIHRAELM